MGDAELGCPVQQSPCHLAPGHVTYYLHARLLSEPDNFSPEVAMLLAGVNTYKVLVWHHCKCSGSVGCYNYGQIV